jgi:amino-acid N-acetyltransferase
MDQDLHFPLTFSGVRPGEASAVTRLVEDAGLPVKDLTPQKLHHFIVARKGDTIVGVVGLEPAGSQALLRSLAVAETHRRKSVGRRLVAAIEKYARSRGTRAIYLLTMGAADFFIKQDYQRVDRQNAPADIQATDEFQTLCPASAQCLRKPIES